MRETKTTFLTLADAKYEKNYRALKRSIERFHPEAEIVRVIPTTPPAGGGYMLNHSRQRDVLKCFENGSDVIVELDADCLLFSELGVIDYMYAHHELNMVTVSHINHPTENWLDYYNHGSLVNGAINFYNNTNAAKEILNFIMKLNVAEYSKPNADVFYSQKLFTALPFMFDGVELLREDQYNYAWFNAHERKLSWENGTFLVNGTELAIAHFSGYQLENPEQFSRFGNVPVDYVLRALLKLYKEELEK